MTTSARMLRLLSLLQTHRFWPGAELAERLEVSARTLRRDIERLRELGYDVDATRGVAGGYQLRAGTSLPPLLLTDEEAVAIAVGLHNAATGGAPGLEDTVLQALTKLAALMPPRLRRRMEALRSQTDGLTPWEGAALDADVVTVLAQASRDHDAITFTYTARGGVESRRRVEPHRLATLGRRWYLVGYDRDRQDWRTFRVDRVSTPAVTGQRFRPRELPAEDAVSYVRASLRSMPTRYTVRVRMATDPEAVEAYMGRWGKAEPDGPGRCVMTLYTDTLDWPVMVLANFDCDFTVEEPTELSDLLGRVGGRFVAARA